MGHRRGILHHGWEKEGAYFNMAGRGGGYILLWLEEGGLLKKRILLEYALACFLMAQIPSFNFAEF